MLHAILILELCSLLKKKRPQKQAVHSLHSERVCTQDHKFTTKQERIAEALKADLEQETAHLADRTKQPGWLWLSRMRNVLFPRSLRIELALLLEIRPW